MVLGGVMDADETDDYPHLARTMGTCSATPPTGEAPALGICLGAQLAAAALGGRAYPGPAGEELGWTKIELTETGRADPVLGALREPAELFEWHHDTFDPPPGATILAGGADLLRPGVPPGQRGRGPVPSRGRRPPADRLVGKAPPRRPTTRSTRPWPGRSATRPTPSACSRPSAGSSPPPRSPAGPRTSVTDPGVVGTGWSPGAVRKLQRCTDGSARHVPPDP